MIRTFRLPMIGAAVLIALLFWASLPQPSQGVTAGSRVPWQGQNWFLHGVNVAWYNYGCDFGCGPNGGVSDPRVEAALRPRFQQLRDAGIHSVRWWTLIGDNAWQVTRDGNGMPTGLDSRVFTDFDAALRLAEEYDLYLNFVIFNFPAHIPSSWINNPAHRQRLAEVLAPLFARYNGNPRVFSWAAFNEPEWDMWGDRVDDNNVVALVGNIVNAVHTNSSAYATIGSGSIDGLAFWRNSGLDFYQAHTYPHFSANWCLSCMTYDEVRTRYNLDKPLVVGEFYGGTAQAGGVPFLEFYNRGYAGAWAWSLFPERTADNLEVNFTWASALSAQAADAGPKAGASGGSCGCTTPGFTIPTPTPTPTTTPTAGTLGSTASVSQASVVPGGSQTASVTVSSPAAQSLVVDVEVYGPAGRIHQRYFENESFLANQQKSFTVPFTVPAGSPSGTYWVKVGLFTAGWGTMLSWNDTAASFTVSTAGTTSTSNPTPTPTTPPPTATATPASATATPTPTSTVAPPQSITGTPFTQGGFTSAGRVSSSNVRPGANVTLTAAVSSTNRFKGVVDVEVYSQAGNRVFQWFWEDVSVARGKTVDFKTTFAVPGNLPPGTYTVKIGIFGPGWDPLRHWNDNAATLTVQ